jgi:hypothetical protein
VITILASGGDDSAASAAGFLAGGYHQDVFRRKQQPAMPLLRKVPVKPSASELTQWRGLYEHSPKRFAPCGSGHLVDLFEETWEAVGTKRGRWFAYVRCYEEIGPLSTSPPCRSGVNVSLPVDSGEISVMTYQARHETQAWRQSASVLPRSDGIYVDHASNDDIHKHYDALFFTGQGVIFVFHFSVLKGPFVSHISSIETEARKSMKWFSHPSPRHELRGLYSVTGQAVSFTVHDRNGSSAEYAGVIDAKAKELKLEVLPIGHTRRKPLKITYKYKSL